MVKAGSIAWTATGDDRKCQPWVASVHASIVRSTITFPFMVPLVMREAPEATVKVPEAMVRLFKVALLLSVTPVGLLTVRVPFAPKIMVPVPLIVWAAEPLNVRFVVLVAFPKVNVAADETEIFPLITMPPEKSQLIIPLVTV